MAEVLEFPDRNRLRAANTLLREWHWGKDGPVFVEIAGGEPVIKFCPAWLAKSNYDHDLKEYRKEILELAKFDPERADRLYLQFCRILENEGIPADPLGVWKDQVGRMKEQQDMIKVRYSLFSMLKTRKEQHKKERRRRKGD